MTATLPLRLKSARTVRRKRRISKGADVRPRSHEAFLALALKGKPRLIPDSEISLLERLGLK